MMQVVSNDEPIRELMGIIKLSPKTKIVVFEKGEFYYAELRTRMPNHGYKTRMMKGWRSRSFVKLTAILDGFVEGLYYGQSVLL